MGHSQVQAFIFDMDMTLIDSARALCLCFQHAQKKMGLRITPEATLLPSVADGLENRISEFTELKAEEDIAQFVHHFMQFGALNQARLCDFYPGTGEMFAQLQSQGAQTGIISIKPRVTIQSILRFNRFHHKFNHIIGGDEVSKKKPDREAMDRMLGMLRTSSDLVVYIGDHISDAQFAANSDVRFIGVLTGRTRREEFQDLPNLAIVSDITQVPPVIWAKEHGERRGPHRI